MLFHRLSFSFSSISSNSVLQPVFSPSILAESIRPDSSSSVPVLGSDSLSAELAHEIMCIQVTGRLDRDISLDECFSTSLIVYRCFSPTVSFSIYFRFPIDGFAPGVGYLIGVEI